MENELSISAFILSATAAYATEEIRDDSRWTARRIQKAETGVLSSAGRWHKSRAAILLQHGKYTDCQFREETRVTWSWQMKSNRPPPEAQVQRNYCGDESTISSRFKNTHLICEGVQRNSFGKGDLSPYIVSPPFESLYRFSPIRFLLFFSRSISFRSSLPCTPTKKKEKLSLWGNRMSFCVSQFMPDSCQLPAFWVTWSIFHICRD